MELILFLGVLILLGIYFNLRHIEKYLSDYFDATNFYEKKKEIDDWNDSIGQ